MKLRLNLNLVSMIPNQFPISPNPNQVESGILCPGISNQNNGLNKALKDMLRCVKHQVKIGIDLCETRNSQCLLALVAISALL